MSEEHLWALYTVEEVAQLSKLNEKTVRRYIRDGRLETHKGRRRKGGSLYLITGYAIIRWLVIKESGFDLYGFSCLPFRLGDEAALVEPDRYITIPKALSELAYAGIGMEPHELQDRLARGEIDGFKEGRCRLAHSGSLWDYIDRKKVFI